MNGETRTYCKDLAEQSRYTIVKFANVAIDGVQKDKESKM